MFLALADNLGAERGGGALAEEFIVVLLDVDGLSNLGDIGDCDLASLFKAVGDLKGVDAFIQKFLGLFQNGAREHDNAGGAVADFVILRG